MMNYLKGVAREFKNIQWPSQKTTVYFTIGVIVVSLIFALYILGLDLGFTAIVERYL